MDRVIASPPGFRRPDAATLSGEEYFLNIGPQHPSTHGVLRLVAHLDGETVREIVPHLGYVHRGMEKMAERQTWLQQIHLSDRHDYLSAHLNNHCVCMAIERGLGIGVPERGEYIRVMVSELQRIQSHLLWWGVLAMDLGAVTGFLYGFAEREKITAIFEELAGARLTMNFFRPGGSAADVPDTFLPRVREVIGSVRRRLDEIDSLLTTNIIFETRTRGVGVLPAAAAISYGCSGAVLRGSGIPFDVRRRSPYSVYDRFSFDVPVGTTGDCYDRCTVRLREVAESCRILEQAAAQFPGGAYRSRERALLKLPAGSYYAQVEAARGLYGTWLVSDGGTRPVRAKTRSPNFSNLSVLDEVARGHKLADMVTILSSLDLVIPDMDR